ncbi:GNAT family N-acetyltransferase [Aquimarina sp. U1-2]|uniref:GNAT family N-acetyltransferase n=1 Tax=Aquimarina sp. U1-2 TaxID=2823141 RepID=UPI001AECB3D8|nr:GNAT family N-acetyltransferase [Aquimarina sp. U1-2]MBP2832002.1 GNAT family N-acetyltransferase [Aquimarina sp. U1-2]
MEKHYELIVKDLNSDKEIEEYKTHLKKEWNNNVYYSYEYLIYFIDKRSSTLKYFLFKSFDEIVVLMPFIVRDITIDNKRTSYFDVISPYGYSGPLFADSLANETILQFWRYVDRWYKKHNIITEFIRFSLNSCHRYYSGKLIPALKNVKGTIVDEKLQWSKFKPKVRNNYRKSIQYGLTIKIYHHPITLNIIQEFFDIYILTMHRNNADYQFFNKVDYFKKLITENSENSIIAMVYKDDIPISTELILKVDDTIYSYLGGTLSDYFYTRPNDFLKIEVLNWARKRAFKYYVLGGGREDDDGLYKYKKAFFPTDDDKIFYTGRKIIDTDVYKMLTKTVSDTSLDLEQLDSSGFFPLYRLNDDS